MVRVGLATSAAAPLLDQYLAPVVSQNMTLSFYSTSSGTFVHFYLNAVLLLSHLFKPARVVGEAG